MVVTTECNVDDFIRKYNSYVDSTPQLIKPKFIFIGCVAILIEDIVLMTFSIEGDILDLDMFFKNRPVAYIKVNCFSEKSCKKLLEFIETILNA